MKMIVRELHTCLLSFEVEADTPAQAIEAARKLPWDGGQETWLGTFDREVLDANHEVLLDRQHALSWPSQDEEQERRDHA
jgi:hypothetical protein